jgi:hypothetical protein
MKKLYYLIIVTLILGLVLTGCELSNVGQVPTSEQKYNVNNPNPNVFDPGDLVAGQNSKVGTVDAWYDANNLYVKYVITDSDWCLIETHLHVATIIGDIPQTKKKNPIPGQFEKNGEHECVSEVLYTYNIEAMGWQSFIIGNGTFFIAAHAVVQNDSEIISEPGVEPLIYLTETAWAANTDFEGKNWATYFEYTVEPLTLNLVEKTPLPLTDPPTPWPPVIDGAWGQLEYYPFGLTFDFDFLGYGLVPGGDYTLIYYPDHEWPDNPWPREGIICLGSGIADGGGEIQIENSVNTGDLPTAGDAALLGGAKIWLVLSGDVTCDVEMFGWHPTEYLFEVDVIEFIDTDG